MSLFLHGCYWLMSRIYLCTGPHTISPPVQTGPAPPVPLQTCGEKGVLLLTLISSANGNQIILFVMITCKPRKWSWRRPHRREVPSKPVSTTKNATWIQLEYKHMGECKWTSSTRKTEVFIFKKAWPSFRNMCLSLVRSAFSGEFFSFIWGILILAPLSSLLPPSPTWAWYTVRPSFLSLSLTYMSMM